MRELCARRLGKTYPHGERRLVVLHELSFRVPLNEITVLLGESGCGKTTLLRVAGGLEAPDAGAVTGLAPGESAFVFQEPRLLPWRSALKNVTFGMKKARGNDDAARALLRGVGLEDFEGAYPDALSGGMSQRVALARALAARPKYLLMDEPFAALDTFTRAAMQRLALNLHRERQVGMLFVTHSVDEALALADSVLLLANGAIQETYRLDGCPYPRDPDGSNLKTLKTRILGDMERKKLP